MIFIKLIFLFIVFALNFERNFAENKKIFLPARELTDILCEDLGDTVFTKNLEAFQERMRNAKSDKYDYTRPKIKSTVDSMIDKTEINKLMKCVYILYKNEGVKEEIKDAFSKVQNNPIGMQLLLDITIENLKGHINPVFIIEKDILEHLPESFELDNNRYTFLLTAQKDLKDNYDQVAPCFKKKDESIQMNIILYKKEDLAYYHGVTKKKALNESIREEKEVKLIGKDISLEKDVIIFHELNHYRHFLQGLGTDDRYLDLETQNTRSKFHDIEVIFSINPMFSPEEELQLTGYTRSRDNQEFYDFINEIAYRCFSNLPIRVLYNCNFLNEVKVSGESVWTIMHRALCLE